jgi:hypothetical protein
VNLDPGYLAKKLFRSASTKGLYTCSSRPSTQAWPLGKATVGSRVGAFGDRLMVDKDVLSGLKLRGLLEQDYGACSRTTEAPEVIQ